jgi:uncharacterized protein DUF4129
MARVPVLNQPSAATAATNQSSGATMPGIDKATGRVLALIVLLVIAAAALRGYLPGITRAAAREQSTDSPASLIAVVTMLCVSVGIVAIAVIARLRDRRAAAASAADRSDWLRGGGGRPAWRALLIGLGVLVAWLVLAWLLAQLFPQHTIPQSTPGTGSSNPALSSPNGPPPTAPHEHGSVLGYLVAPTVIFLLLLAAATVIASRRQQRAGRPRTVADDRFEPSVPAVGPESLARAAELGLAEIGDLSREPREAIIACYAAMERQLEHVPDAEPREFDTPTEVLARAIEHHALRPDSATQLVELFAEARFSPHVMNEGHREIAVNVLRSVLEELRSAA